MPKLLVTARDSAEAHMIRSELEQAGITATVQGETLAFGRGDLPMTPQTMPQVWVNEEDFAPAKEIAEAFFRIDAEAANASTPDPWRCGACDTEVEGQFAVCWNCGADHPKIIEPNESGDGDSVSLDR